MFSTDFRVQFYPTTTRHNSHRDKLADAELTFTSGPLEGVTLKGFGIWTAPAGVRVTLPGVTLALPDGGSRYVTLLRTGATGGDGIRRLFTDAWRAFTNIEQAIAAGQVPREDIERETPIAF